MSRNFGLRRRQYATAVTAKKRKRAHEIFLQMRADVLAALRSEPDYIERQMLNDDLFHASLERHGVKS